MNKVFIFFKIYRVATNISSNKDNPAMKFYLLIEYNMRNIFLKNHAANEVGILVPDLFLFFKNTSHEVKASG